MSNILKWLSGGVALVLLGFGVYLHTSYSSMKSLVREQDTIISKLEREVDSLSEAYFACNRQKDAINNAITKTRESLSLLKEDKQSIQRGIDDLLTNNKTRGRDSNGEKENAPSTTLDPELIRMLGAACERVRGSECPHP